MADLHVRFAVSLARLDLPGHEHSGPLFSRWLPDGRADALLEEEATSYRLEIWFERRGFMERGFVRYDHKRQEVDERVIPMQSVLDAGALRGEVLLHDVPAAQIAVVTEGRIGDGEYVRLGKRLVKGIVDPALLRVARLLRVQYGQFWLEVPEAFDSRRYSLGHHCDLLNMRWSLDRHEWADFCPDAPEHAAIILSFDTGIYEQLLTKEDWPDIQELFRGGFQPSLATALAARAHELLAESRFRHALLEAISALEVSIQERLRSVIGRDPTFQAAVQSFWSLPLPAQTVVAAAGLVTARELAQALEGITRRNAIVHEGREGSADDADLAESVLVVVQKLVPGPRTKTPRFPNSNTVYETPASKGDGQEG